MTDEQIDKTDVPELSDDFFAKATLRTPLRGEAVTLKVDPEILAWFQAQGDAWEQRLNAALRIYMQAHQSYQKPTKAGA